MATGPPAAQSVPAQVRPRWGETGAGAPPSPLVRCDRSRDLLVSWWPSPGTVLHPVHAAKHDHCKGTNESFVPSAGGRKAPKPHLHLWRGATVEDEQITVGSDDGDLWCPADRSGKIPPDGGSAGTFGGSASCRGLSALISPELAISLIGSEAISFRAQESGISGPMALWKRHAHLK